MSDANALQRQVQSSVEHFQKAIHKLIMPLQRRAYSCMADCSDATKSPDAIEKCYAKCQGPIEKADSHVQFVINNFQRDLERCNVDCQSEESQDSYEKCVSTCAEKILKKFPDDTDDLLSKLKAL